MKLAQPTVQRYHGSLVLLHWLLALAIVLMLLAGHFITAATPNSDPEKLNHLRGHMVVGMAVAVLMLIRVVLRFVTAHPPQAHSGIAAADALAPWVHRAVYALVFTMIASGFSMGLHFGLPQIVFQGQGTLPPDFASFAGRWVHGITAGLLALLIALHIGAALYHQLIVKDGLMARMGWGKR